MLETPGSQGNNYDIDYPMIFQNCKLLTIFGCTTNTEPLHYIKSWPSPCQYSAIFYNNRLLVSITVFNVSNHH